jgi:hypothetical protein
MFADATTALLPNDTDPILLKFNWYEDGGTNKRMSVELSSNGQNGLPADPADAWIEFGVYNATTGMNEEYSYRTVNIGGPTWSVISGAPRNRTSPGWRAFRCLIYATKITFQVDGLPATPFEVSCPTLPGKKFTSVAFGSANGLPTSAGGGAYMDDLHVSYLSDEGSCAVCSDVPSVTTVGVLDDGQTTVDVTPVDPDATRVNVYANGVLIGYSEATPFASTVTVTVDTDPGTAGNQGLVDGTEIKVTQIKEVTPTGCTPQITESCQPGTGVVVGSCQQIPAVQIGNVLAAGMITVKVTGISTSAASVTVYGSLPAPWSQSASTGGATSLDVTVPTLVHADSVYATQTIGVLEGCKPGPAKEVDNCNQVANVTFGGLVTAGQVGVIVSGIDPTASLVTVYNATGSLGSINPASATWISVPVTALVLNDVLHATQTINTIEGCPNGPTRTVGAAGIIEDFNGTVAVVQSGVTPTAYRTWYDATEGNVTDVKATGTRTTLFGSKCLNIWDHGWGNGAYAIFEKVIPAAGEYHLEIDMLIDEPEGGDYDFYSTYQVGVRFGVNAVHRAGGGSSGLGAITDLVGNYPCLTAQRDGTDATEAVKVYVPSFTAAAGDDLLIAFSTDVGGWSRGKSAAPISDTTWPGMKIDNIKLIPGPKPQLCTDVPPLTILPTSDSPLEAGGTIVTVSNIGATASLVKVLAGTTVIGEKVPEGASQLDVPVIALVAGDTITASQTVGGIESCQCPGAPGPMVGEGINSPLKIAVAVRERDAGSPITGPIEWVGASTTTSGAPQGKDLHTGLDWQTMTFTFTGTGKDPMVSMNAGNGQLDGANGYVLEGLGLSIADANSGRYVLYIDSIVNGTTTICNFDTDAPGSTTMFRIPSHSGTTSNKILVYPDIAEVDVSEGADGTAQSYRVEWQFLDTQLSRYLRLTTFDDGDSPDMTVQNPVLDINQTLTIKFLLSGPPDCGDVFADSDGDLDVDMVDFAAFQRCLTAGTVPILPECGCFDRPFNGVIGADDLTAFHNCASGSGVPAIIACDD